MVDVDDAIDVDVVVDADDAVDVDVVVDVDDAVDADDAVDVAVDVHKSGAVHFIGVRRAILRPQASITIGNQLPSSPNNVRRLSSGLKQITIVKRWPNLYLLVT